MIWDAGSGQILNTIDCHPDIVHSITFNRDGSRIATTCKDKKIRSIDPRSGLVVAVSKFFTLSYIDKNLLSKKCYHYLILKIILYRREFVTKDHVHAR